MNIYQSISCYRPDTCERNQTRGWSALDPPGYIHDNIEGKSNIPTEPADTAEVAICPGNATWISQYDGIYSMPYSVTLDITLDENVSVIVYNWKGRFTTTDSELFLLIGFIFSHL
jgi:hypothetical protein